MPDTAPAPAPASDHHVQPRWRIARSLALLPLILPQGLYVKLRAAQMDEAAGPRAGTAGQGRPLRILILGDSSAAGVGVATQSDALTGHLVAALATDFTVSWKLCARIGATTASITELLKTLPVESFDVALTALGVNDVKNGHSLSSYLRNTASLYECLTARFGVQLICVSGMPPVADFPLLPQPLKWALHHRSQLFDAAHRDLIADMKHVAYLQGPTRLDPADMAADGFHPGAAIYREWGRLAADLLRQNWPVQPC